MVWRERTPNFIHDSLSLVYRIVSLNPSENGSMIITWKASSICVVAWLIRENKVWLQCQINLSEKFWHVVGFSCVLDAAILENVRICIANCSFLLYYSSLFLFEMQMWLQFFLALIHGITWRILLVPHVFLFRQRSEYGFQSISIVARSFMLNGTWPLYCDPSNIFQI